jgi:predicted dehydrogenase
MGNVRIGVIGVGHLGQHHARLLASMDGVELVGVCDVNRARADEIGTKFGAPAFSDSRELLGRVDAVTVAVPTVVHLDVGLPFLVAGVATLIEKPIAASVADADRLVEAAERGGAMLATGHTERFNPAVAAALPIISEPRFIEIHRLGTFPERSLDIDVIFDLMIHDLDLLLSVGALGGDGYRGGRRQRAHAERRISRTPGCGLHPGVLRTSRPAASAASAYARRGFSRMTRTCRLTMRLRNSKCSGW